MKRIVNALSELSWATRAFAFLVLFATTAVTLPAQTFTTLFTFEGTDDQYPGPLVQGADGNLYGTTYGFPDLNYGSVFKITPSGTLTTLHSFCSQSGCPDGQDPTSLILGTDGNFYGTTWHGGALLTNVGTVFEITPSGTLTTLYSFCDQSGCPDGESPSGGLIQAADGDFYGTTVAGGATTYGTVFKITPGGMLTTIHSFCIERRCTDGANPYATLIQVANGDFYGTTYNGGANSYGTVFKITPRGALTTLYSFCAQSGCTDGQYPYAGLVQATTGDFYGTTYFGGGANNGGTVFKITPSGTLTTLYSFCVQSGCPDGENPSGLVPATNGDFYGTTSFGGASNDGTVFKITPSGTLTTLYSFCAQSGCPDGEAPAGLVQSTNGAFYGTTSYGGYFYIGCEFGCGTIFRLSLGLGPFVKTVPQYGQVGRVIRILGTDLTGATAVTFNGTPAAFAVVAPTEITATLPPGATTGRVRVITPTGTLLSASPFTVLP